MSFYDQVLREMIAAIGAALFFGNGWALLKRRADEQRRGVRAGTRSAKAKGASRVRTTGRTRQGELVQAPLARTATFMVVGFVMMIAGIAALTA